MAAEVTKTRIRWGVALVVALGLALGVVLSERIEERKATRIEERATVRQATQPPSPGICTDGVDCYCDTVTDPNILMCEDFEAAVLYEDLSAGNWCIDNDGSGAGRAPGDLYNVGAGSCSSGDEALYGVWWDQTACPGNTWRGCNQYFIRRIGLGSSYACGWTNDASWDDGSASARGITCTNNACGMKEWRADNLWDGNFKSCIDIIRAGEFDDEIPSLTDPWGANSIDGIFDGQTVYAARNPAFVAGEGDRFAAGIHGIFDFPNSQEIGITRAFAFASNWDAVGLENSQLKYDEWGDSAVATIGGHLMVMKGISTDPDDSQPFQQGFTQNNCNTTTINNATVNIGSIGCSGGTFQMWANDDGMGPWVTDQKHGTQVYSLAVHWPDRTEWKCIRAHFTGLTTASTSVKIWLGSLLIVDVTGVDTTSTPYTATNAGIGSFFYNNYSNLNISSPGSTQPTYRYSDNLHITAGSPVSCEAIGF